MYPMKVQKRFPGACIFAGFVLGGYATCTAFGRVGPCGAGVHGGRQIVDLDSNGPERGHSVKTPSGVGPSQETLDGAGAGGLGSSDRRSSSTRTEAFSDGVLAITITLLVIDIGRPEAEPGLLLHDLLAQWPSYLAFVVSFVYVGIIWLNHHALFARVRFVDRGLLWINLGILLTTALLPFPTAVLATAWAEGNVGNERTAVALYALVAGLMSTAWIPIYPYLRRHPELLNADTPASYVAAQRIRPFVGVALYAVAGAVGLVMPVVGVALFATMVVYHAVTSEGVHRR